MHGVGAHGSLGEEIREALVEYRDLPRATRFGVQGRVGNAATAKRGTGSTLGRCSLLERWRRSARVWSRRPARARCAGSRRRPAGRARVVAGVPRAVPAAARNPAPGRLREDRRVAGLQRCARAECETVAQRKNRRALRQHCIARRLLASGQRREQRNRGDSRRFRAGPESLGRWAERHANTRTCVPERDAPIGP